MFQGKGIAMSKVRRMAAVVLVGGSMLTITAAPASAQSLAGGGSISAHATCNMRTNSATVDVHVVGPDAFPKGVYFYTYLYAKARSDARFNLISSAPSGLVTPWVTSPSGATYRGSTKIFSGSFTGRINNSYYDIAIQWWSRTPTGQWLGPNTFYVPGDGHSSVRLYDDWGYGTDVSTCFM